MEGDRESRLVVMMKTHEDHIYRLILLSENINAELCQLRFDYENIQDVLATKTISENTLMKERSQLQDEIIHLENRLSESKSLYLSSLKVTENAKSVENKAIATYSEVNVIICPFFLSSFLNL